MSYKSVPHPGARNVIVDGKYTCTKCGETKPVDQFSKRSARPLGITSHCKACCAVRLKTYTSSNKERIRRNHKAYREANSEKISEYQSAYREANREKLGQYFSEYAKQNLPKKQATTTKRRAGKLMATPRWANLAEIEKIYANSTRIATKTGQRMHVDHIVPLVHPLVCGLHCEANLRIIPAEKNLRKGNNWWPNMPC